MFRAGIARLAGLVLRKSMKCASAGLTASARQTRLVSHAGTALPRGQATDAVHHAGPLELAHALRHPGHAQSGGHQVHDGLHLDGLL